MSIPLEAKILYYAFKVGKVNRHDSSSTCKTVYSSFPKSSKTVFGPGTEWKWLLRDAKMFKEPIPAKGRLGLYDVELDPDNLPETI